jgi:phosphatidate cytidylyltransferase
VTRVLSALVLLPVVIGTVWFLPPVATLLLATAFAVLAFVEYRRIALKLGAMVDAGIGGTAVLLACVIASGVFDTALAGYGAPFVLSGQLTLLFVGALIAAGAIAVGRGQPGPGVLADTAATLFAPVYIGLPLGVLAAIRGAAGGREAVGLLALGIIVSDSAQYYTGRAFGRRPLAPSISPKKTVEGAIGGVVIATLVIAMVGRFVFGAPLWILALLGAAISLLGIVGDLFESLLKRSAGVKDSSNLIPGHGGVLDRIDSWLFAAPVYFVFVRFIA